MALDLTTLGAQVRQMSDTLVAQTQATAERLAQVSARYLEQSGAEPHWQQAVDLSHNTATWLLARPVEPLATVHAVLPPPAAYALAASDGSHIDIDRHGTTACYLINTGRAYLRYGEQPAARLTSHPTLYYREEDLYLTDGARRIPIEGNYLSVQRDVEELRAVCELASELLHGDMPRLALQDGTLVRWALAGADKFVQQHFLRQYFACLDQLRQSAIPVASYISRPRATEVSGMVRLMFCPDVDVAQGRGAKCSVCSDVRAGKRPSCDICHGLVDADILFSHLSEGQRSALFASMSDINVREYRPRGHQIFFFYMRCGRELARVEMPQWVAEDRAQVDLIHSLMYDQCARGQGYPVALARSHEQAVIRTADRRTFQRMVESSLLRADLPATSSRKRESKERAAL